MGQKKRDRELSELIKNKHFFIVANSKPKSQSRVLDSVLFPDKLKIEKELKENNPLFSEYAYHKKDDFDKSQPWIGLHPQNLETTYIDFMRLFEFLKINEFEIKVCVDIGSAYGRAGVVSPCVYPEVKFIGYEIVKERVEESNRAFKRLNLKNSISYHKNVMFEEIELADIYIIYDFSHLEDIYHLIEKLKRKDKCFLLAVRGDQSPKIVKRGFKDLYVLASPIKNSNWHLFKFDS